MTFGDYAIAHGDVLACLRELPSNEFDALLCDPPYGFRFMGKAWDYDVPSVDVWREALRVLKPGAPLVSFGGARTFHRIAIGIEDAGFELRDCLMWLYGKGFPKSQNIGLAIDKAAGATRAIVGTRTLTGNAALTTAEKGGTYGVQVRSVPAREVPVTAPATDLAQAWDGYGTALKPAWEPIILARKPLAGTMAQNVAAYGVGGLAVGACRIGDEPRFNPPAGNKPGGSSYNLSAVGMPQDAEGREAVGRWPANLVLDEEAATQLDASVPAGRSVPYRANEATGAVLPMTARSAGGYSDSGGPSRFFYCAKVSTKERELGCESLPMKSAGEMTERVDEVYRVWAGAELLGEVANEAEAIECCKLLAEEGTSAKFTIERPQGLDNPRAGAGRTGGARNHHPTLKPLSLARWLAALIKPPTDNATLLIPYSGAGSEVIGALQAGWPSVFGIEGEADYIAIAHARIAAWGRQP